MRNKNILKVIYETAYAEYGSALEMLSACKLAEKETFCFGYFHHAKDEYKHTQSFLSILSKYGKETSYKISRQYRFNAQAVINKGYVSKKGFLIEIMKLKNFIAYVYTNELLAKESFDGILKLVNSNTEEGKK